jgi:hypothetical protein
MLKSNTFYLFLVAIFLTLSALSFYWFNNVDSYTNTHSAKENPLLEGSANVWHKFNAVLEFLDVIGDSSGNENDYNKANAFDNPIKKSANVLSSFEVNDQLEQEIKSKELESASPSINELMEERELKEKPWYQRSSKWISKKGFYVFKKDRSLELNWQSSKGKTYSISIPY